MERLLFALAQAECTSATWLVAAGQLRSAAEHIRHAFQRLDDLEALSSSRRCWLSRWPA